MLADSTVIQQLGEEHFSEMPKKLDWALTTYTGYRALTSRHDQANFPELGEVLRHCCFRQRNPLANAPAVMGP